MQARWLAAVQLQLTHERIRLTISTMQAAASEDSESEDSKSEDSPMRDRAWHSADPPKEVCCPITPDLLQDTVRAWCGHVFERDSDTVVRRG